MEALDLLHGARVDHGVRAIEDEALMQRLVDEAVPLTVCPLSNVKLRLFDTLADYVLGRMLAGGAASVASSRSPEGSLLPTG